MSFFIPLDARDGIPFVPSGDIFIKDMGKERHIVTVKKTVQLTPTVRGMELELPEGAQLSFKAGQYLDIRLTDPKNRELEGEWSGFSITSSPLQKEYLEIAVARRGPLTQELHEAAAGSKLEIRGPEGDFVYEPSQDREPVFIAGGIGITPIMSMLRYLRDMQFPVAATLIYSCRSLEDVIFFPELLGMDSCCEGFTALFTLTRSSPIDWKGETRRVDQAMLEETISDPADKSYYICGPQEMMLMLTYCLRDMGVGKEQIATELW